MRRLVWRYCRCAPCRASPAQGNPQCTAHGVSGLFGGAQAQNICNAGVDGASLFVPVAGIARDRRQSVPGRDRRLRRFPHLGITLRVNATQVVIPDFNYNGVGNTVVGARQTLIAPAPLVEGALGIFRGLRGGDLALDVLGSAQLLPTSLIDDVHIDVNARTDRQYRTGARHRRAG